MLSKELVDIFKHLHAHPELSNEEDETTRFLGEILTKWNVKYEYLEGTGLIAYMDKGVEQALCFRADIDALPITEANSFSYKSQNIGVMHACGHDGHMTMLLGFIKAIIDNELEFNKSLLFVFQPAEEKDGGAQRVLEHPLFSKYQIEKIFGMHLWPQMAEGEIGVKSGPLMATNLPFEIKIKGKKSHAATPHLGVDTTIVLSELINNLQYLIAKYTSPFAPVVINIGKINGGVSGNVILDELDILGTIRVLDDQLLQDLKKEVLLILKSLEAKYHCELCFKQLEISYPVVVNDEEIVKDSLEKFSLNLVEVKEPTLASEDFGFYCQQYPSCFYFLGIRNELKNHLSMLHTETLSFELDVLKRGIDLYQKILENYGK